MKRLLGARDVAELLRVNEDTARKYMRRMCCVVFPGGGLRVEEAELERWVSGNTQAPAERKPRKKPTVAVYDLELFEPDGRIKRRHTKQ